MAAKDKRGNLKSVTKNLLSAWDCLCEDCCQLRAVCLTNVTGVPVQPLQMTKPDAMVEASLREFATEIDVDDFLEGRVHPSRMLVLYHGPQRNDQAILYEVSADLEEQIKAKAQVQ
jgi:hypothetical protein